MEKLVLHPTDTSQWHALVNEAQASRALQLDEQLESYLVFLLMRYASQPELGNSVLAMDFLDSCHAVGHVRHDLLRDVGDKSLLFSGLFPGLAEKRQVTLSYFIDMGQSAYGTLSSCSENSVATLFSSLCEEFRALMDVLHAMRDMSGESCLLPLDAYELWKEQGSESAFDALQKQTDGLPNFDPDILKKSH